MPTLAVTQNTELKGLKSFGRALGTPHQPKGICRRDQALLPALHFIPVEKYEAFVAI